MRKYSFRKAIPLILFAILLALALRSIMFASYVVEGESMEPTLRDGNLLMVNKVVYDIGDVERFDVIVFHANKQEDFVKRVIGLPGDEILYKNDKLYINGEYVEEPFLDPYKAQTHKRPYTEDFTLEEVANKQTVPDNHLFVLGDNRPESMDGRSFGFIKTRQLVGKVDITYWPISQAKLSFGK